MKEFVVFDKNGQWNLMKSNDWLVHGDFSERDTMPGMSTDKLKPALAALKDKAKTRKNKKTGETEFLLHRGVGEQEGWAHDSNEITDRTSWTPHYHVAHSFARTYNSTDPASKHRELTLSAWVPESQIHSIPAHDLKPSHAFYDKLKEEHEVVVKPHQFNYADQKTKDATYKASKKSGLI